ncbi:MAG: phage tail protein [Campylobacterota bacterium]|nr:phage tail protein [Campylobacterota bacterium]
MAKFGLACEGITDQIVIENILCGYYKDYDDLDEEIQPLQPPRDETDTKQADFSNWELLLDYLSQKRFRDDVLNSEYVIIQIDTDDSGHTNFGVSHYDENNIELSISTLVDNVQDKLIEQIDKNEKFYQSNHTKIIFAISVHSLECWILPLYKDKNNKTKNCHKELQRHVDASKNYQNYDKLTRDFTKYKKLMKIVPKSESFQIFVNKLPDIEEE